MRRFVLAAVAVLVLFGRSAPLRAFQAPPQPDEVAVLKARIADLEGQLQAARLKITELEARLAEANARTPGAPADAGRAVAQGDETLSPQHLLSELKAEFAAAFPEPVPSDERGRYQRLRVVSQWANKINHDHRERIDWVCRIVSRDLIDADEAYVDLLVVDPATGEDVGSRFVIEWPRRLRATLARFDDGMLIRLRGLLEPEVRTNESRAEPGAFDIPPLIGPYVEFRFTVQVMAVGAVEKQPSDGGPAPIQPGPER